MRDTAYRDDKGEHCAMILTEVAGCMTTRFGARLSLMHLKEFHLWVDQDLFANLNRRFKRALSLLDRPESADRVMGLVVVAAGKRAGHFLVRDACFMRTTAHWIPSDSQYESWVAEALVQEDRRFLKPMRYDAFDEEVFPDFMLLDAGEKPVPMEIYGMTGNRKYERRKREKIAIYEGRGEAFWQWEVDPKKARQNAWTSFPERWAAHRIASRSPVPCGGTLKRVSGPQSLAPVLLSESTVGR